MKMRIKDFGIKHEYELVGELKKAEYEACRLPGSSVRNPDLLAGDGESVFVIEVKITTNNRIIIRTAQIKNLIRFAWKFKAEPWVALKFINQTSWIFIRPNAMQISKDNQKLSIDYHTAIQKGVNIKELASHELQKRFI
jgi:Holliday junction resolvase